MPSLRQARRAVTEQRIIEALTALIDEEHPLEISTATVAKRAAVSEPTLPRLIPAPPSRGVRLGQGWGDDGVGLAVSWAR